MVTTKGNFPFLAFNAGEIGKEVQGRITMENYAATADTMENYLPTSEGPMITAPGGEFFSELPGMTYLRRFVFNLQQKYLLGFSDNELRIIQNGAILERPAVTSTVGNGTFAGSLAYDDDGTDATRAMDVLVPIGAQAIFAYVNATDTTGVTWVLAAEESDVDAGDHRHSAARYNPTRALGNYTAAVTATGAAAAGALACAVLLPSSLGVDVSVSYGSQGQATATGSIATVSGLTFNAAAVGRKVAAAITFEANATISTVTIGGITASRLAQAASGTSCRAEIWIADVPTGTSGAVVVTVSTGNPTVAVSTFSVLNASGAVPDSAWTDISDGVSEVVIGGGLYLLADGSTNAGVRQQVATSSAGTLHALRIVVEAGPVTFRVGSTAGGSDYIATTSLNKGTHSLAFTPSGSYWIEFLSSLTRAAIISSCTIEAAGDLVLATPWLAEDFHSLRFRQSKDVLYVASGMTAKRRIERRSTNSWSIAYSDEKDGPFEAPNTDVALQLTPSVQDGNGILTASQAYFETGHVGTLFLLGHGGQEVEQLLREEGNVTRPIRISGVGTDRQFTWGATGTFNGTIRLQRAFATPDNFVDYKSTRISGTTVEDDGLSNQIVYYRLAINDGEWGFTYSESAISQATGTTFAGSNIISDPENVFDGSTATTAGAANSVDSYIGKTYSSPTVITKVVVQSGASQGFIDTNATVSIEVYGKQGSTVPASATDGTLLATDVFTDSSSSLVTRTITISSQVGWTHVWVRVGRANGGLSSFISISEIQFYTETATPATAGSATGTLFTDAGYTNGICRVTGYTSATEVDMEVLTPFARAEATMDWQEGSWSDTSEHPTSVDIFDGRLWHGHLDRVWGSASDLYESQAAGTEDASAIAVSYGGSNIKALLGLSRLIIFDEASENVIRSSAFDEPITPSNLTRREMSSYGVGNCEPYKVDSRGLFLDRSGIHLMEMVYNVDISDYVANPLTRLHRDIGRPGITQIAVARRPETRLFAPRADGQLLTKLYSPSENVFGWARINRDGLHRSVEVLPGDVGEGEDEVWMVVERRVEYERRYYIEKMGPLYWPTKADASCVDSFVREDQPELEALRFYGSQTQHMSVTGDLAGNADGKTGIVSFFVRLTGSDSGENTVYVSSGGTLRIRRTAAGKWQIIALNSALGTVLTLTSASSWGVANGWHHVLAAWDLANGVGELYINDEDDLASGATVVDDTIDYTRSGHTISRASSTTLLVGDLAAFYLNVAETVDITDEDVRRKFSVPVSLGDADETVIYAPVWIGSDGSYPTGTAPIIYLRDEAASGYVNRGTGGNFTPVGALWDATPPVSNFAAQSTVMSGFDHLIGEAVTVFSDGVDVGDFVVDASGEIDMGHQSMKRVGGLKYRSRYKSSILALGGQLGTGFTQMAEAEHIVFALTRSSNVLSYGTDFDGDMDDLAANDMADAITEDGLISGISEQVTVPGVMRRDPRICVESWSPEPVSIQGIVLSQKVNEQT
jgi:hypothetical protein